MWIEIENAIFTNGEFSSLNYLIQILSWYPTDSIPRYNVFVDLENVVSTDNFRKLKSISPDIEQFLQKNFDDRIINSAGDLSLDYKVSFTPGKKKFNIEESIRFFSQPFLIILENNKNDSYFILSIMRYFDDSKKLIEFVNNGWIKFENAGGCTNVKNFILGLLNGYEQLAYRNNRSENDYLNAIVILDSDKEYPTQTDKETYSTLKGFLQSSEIKYHILEKRAMENYMPMEVFEELKQTYSKKPDIIAWLNVFLNLSENSQKDYLNIAKGFPKDELGNVLPLEGEIDKLFKLNITDAQIIGKGLKLMDFKNSFPLFYINSPRVNKFSLKNRCNSNELEDICIKILNSI